jgi:hypothetical protein
MFVATCLIFVLHFLVLNIIRGGTVWRIWVGHCATGRKVAGMTPDCVTDIFH